MMDIDKRTAALCASPAGCTFLLVVEENDLDPAVVADPGIAIHVAAIALGQIDVWASDHEAVVGEALEHGPRLRNLARAVLAQESAAWWFAPVDRVDQWCILGQGNEVTAQGLVSPASPPTSWELYAQKPQGAIYSSTPVNGTCSILAAMEHLAGDFLPEPPIGRVRVQAASRARVFEVGGPQDWHQLASRYSAIDKFGRTVPNWGQVAKEWDAVHLTLGGLLTAEQVRVESGLHWTELRGWHTEQTAWMRWCFEEVKKLPDLAEPPPSSVGIEAATRLFLLRDVDHEKP